MANEVKILGKREKQPSETKTYAVDYSEYFSNRTDLPATFTVTATAGLTVVSSVRSGNVIYVKVSGGTDGVQYLVTVLLVTSTDDSKEANFYVKVKDIA